MRVVLCHRQCRRHGGETGGVDRRPCSIFKPSRYIVSRLNKEVCCSPNIPPDKKTIARFGRHTMVEALQSSIHHHILRLLVTTDR